MRPFAQGRIPLNTEAAAARKAPRQLFRGMGEGADFCSVGEFGKAEAGQGHVGVSAAGQVCGPSAGQGQGRVGCGRAVQVCVKWMQRPVSASWNIIQYPLPSGAKRETGTYELYFFNGSGGLWRRSAGTP